MPFFFFSLFSVPLFKGFPGSAGGKEPTCHCRRHRDQVQSLVWEDPLEEAMAIHSNFLAWRIPWTEKPSGLQSMGLQRVGHNWSMHAPLFKWAIFSGEKNLNPPTQAQPWLLADIPAETCCSCLSRTPLSSHSSCWFFSVLVFTAGQPLEPALPSVWSGTNYCQVLSCFIRASGRLRTGLFQALYLIRTNLPPLPLHLCPSHRAITEGFMRWCHLLWVPYRIWA